MRRAAAVVVGVLMCELAASATIHRCGADGRTFSQTPCRDADGVAVPVDDSPSDDRVQQARDVATREAAMAARLARQRQTWERRPAPGPAVIPHTSSETANEPPRARARARSRDFRAVSPAVAASRPER